MKLNILNDEKALTALESLWSSLYMKVGNYPFQSYEWNAHWWIEEQKGKSLFVISLNNKQ